MNLLRCRPAALPAQRADVAVVMDVFRMTSTAAVLMRRPSCVRVSVAANLDDVQRLDSAAGAAAGRQRVIISELAAASRLGVRVDNSPARVLDMEFVERTPVLVTTNGTKVLLAAAGCAERVLLASFIDVRAVARYIAAMAMPSVMLLPAGNVASGQGCIEDDLCADTLAALLAGQEPNSKTATAMIRADPRIMRRVASEPTFSADLELALRGDPSASVLEFQALDAGVGHIVRAE